MKIKGIIKKLRKSGNGTLIEYAGIMEHMNNNGFFGRYEDQIDLIKYDRIESMLKKIKQAVNPDYGVETGQILRAAFVGLVEGYKIAVKKRKPRKRLEDAGRRLW